MRAATTINRFIRPIVKHYVAGKTLGHALRFTEELKGCGLLVSLDHLGEPVVELAASEAAGMTYINDKPTGALLRQVSFGGDRISGTNDKMGSRLALQRWLNGRFIKETLTPSPTGPTHISP